MIDFLGFSYCQQNYSRLQQKLADGTIRLVNPNPEKNFYVLSNDSIYCVGAALLQTNPVGKILSVSANSRSFSTSEFRLSYYHTIYSQPVILYTDQYLFCLPKKLLEATEKSFISLLNGSLTSIIKDGHLLNTAERPEFTNFFMTHNKHTSALPCHHCVSTEYRNSLITDST